MAIHHEMTDNFEAVNIKRSIASVFQANYNTTKQDVEEVDAGSVHTSHYRYVIKKGGNFYYINNIIKF